MKKEYSIVFYFGTQLVHVQIKKEFMFHFYHKTNLPEELIGVIREFFAPTLIPVVINNCYGGFGLSEKAEEFIRARKATQQDSEEFYNLECDREDPHMVAAVQELGDEANDTHADLQIEWVPEGLFGERVWVLMEYDGLEHTRVHTSPAVLSQVKKVLQNTTYSAQTKVVLLEELLEWEKEIQTLLRNPNRQ